MEPTTHRHWWVQVEQLIVHFRDRFIGAAKYIVRINSDCLAA